MLIRHPEGLKLDSTNKVCKVYATNASGRIRWKPFPGCKTTKHISVQPLAAGKFRPSMEACRQGRGGLSLLRYYHDQPHETHQVVGTVRFNPREKILRNL